MGVLGTQCYSAHDGVVRSSTWTLARAVAASSLAPWDQKPQGCGGHEGLRPCLLRKIWSFQRQEDARPTAGEWGKGAGVLGHLEAAGEAMSGQQPHRPGGPRTGPSSQRPELLPLPPAPGSPCPSIHGKLLNPAPQEAM